jgi:hypothetical protein
MATIYIRPHGLDNGLNDYQVVVKPNVSGANRFGIETMAEALAYADELHAKLSYPVKDET